MATVSEKVRIARNAFNRNVTLDLNWRKEQLRALHRLITENLDAFVEASISDFKRTRYEVLSNEFEPLKHEIEWFLKNMDELVKPVRVKKVGWTVKADEPFIKNEPYGVSLVIAAWNGPVLLLFLPAIGAIAAGNCVIMKPSEWDPHLEQLIVDLVPKYLDKECFHVVTGGPQETTEILKERYDFIFFTGSPMVGRIIYKAAAEHLTPVCLELGGKSPVYFDDSVSDLETAVRRLVWGKFTNGGQICIGPDYVLVNSAKLQDKIVQLAKKILVEFYGNNPNGKLAQIINDRNVERIRNLITTSTGKIELGGNVDAANRIIEPTIITDVSPSDPIMQDEIFGPVLPMMVIPGVEEAISYIKSNEKPLAMYIFSTNKEVIDKFLEETSAGGVCVNDTVLQIMAEGLPFGGVGNAGLGQYHGRHSFELFSHPKPVLVRNYDREVEELMKGRYPPHTEEKAQAAAENIKRELSV